MYDFKNYEISTYFIDCTMYIFEPLASYVRCYFQLLKNVVANTQNDISTYIDLSPTVLWNMELVHLIFQIPDARHVAKGDLTTRPSRRVLSTRATRLRSMRAFLQT